MTHFRRPIFSIESIMSCVNDVSQFVRQVAYVTSDNVSTMTELLH